MSNVLPGATIPGLKGGVGSKFSTAQRPESTATSPPASGPKGVGEKEWEDYVENQRRSLDIILKINAEMAPIYELFRQMKFSQEDSRSIPNEYTLIQPFGFPPITDHENALYNLTCTLKKEEVAKPEDSFAEMALTRREGGQDFSVVTITCKRVSSPEDGIYFEFVVSSPGSEDKTFKKTTSQQKIQQQVLDAIVEGIEKAENTYVSTYGGISLYDWRVPSKIKSKKQTMMATMSKEEFDEWEREEGRKAALGSPAGQETSAGEPPLPDKPNP